MILGARIQLPASVGAFVLAVALIAGGCGPVGYINQVTLKADTAVAAATAVDAQRFAPYWYTLAVQYLHRAREEAALADFEAANRFGKKATNAADKAKKLAIERAANPGDEEWMPPPSLRTKSKAGATEAGQ